MPSIVQTPKMPLCNRLLVSQMERGTNAVQDAPSLSFRQRQILDCIIKGYHNKTIAHHLGIEVVTVKMHIGVLFRKLGVTNRTEAAVRGLALYSDRSREPAVPESKPAFGVRSDGPCAISPRWRQDSSRSTAPVIADRRTRSPSTV